MDNRITYREEVVGRAYFLSLEWESIHNVYCVCVDGEIIVWNEGVRVALRNYEAVKANLLNGSYIREDLVYDDKNEFKHS